MSITDKAYNVLHQICAWLMKHGYVTDYFRAIEYIDALSYYIGTGRLSGSEVKTIAEWNNDTVSRVARKLFAIHSDTGDFQVTMDAIREYL